MRQEGICESKYVEDAKAARSVRVWGSAPIKINRHSLFFKAITLFSEINKASADAGPKLASRGA